MNADTLLTKAVQYLTDILGDPLNGDQAKPWYGADKLPYFLQGPYFYYEIKLFGRGCLLMMSGTSGDTPATVRKHWQMVSKQFDGNVLYLIETVSSFNRKRLIEQGVPFLVPGNQLYLPPLGIDLREYFKPGKQTHKKSKLSAAAQAVVLREILHRDCSGLPAKELARIMEYSPMTITRAINELDDLEIVEADKIGREKHLRFLSHGKSLWATALPKLQNPVTKRAWIVFKDKEKSNFEFDRWQAGESAMAHYTALSANRTHWAVSSNTWAALIKRKDVHILESKAKNDINHFQQDREAIEIEIWAYTPKIINSDSSFVDPLSLWLSIEENPDPRIEIEREFLLEQVWKKLPWL